MNRSKSFLIEIGHYVDARIKFDDAISMLVELDARLAKFKSSDELEQKHLLEELRSAHKELATIKFGSNNKFLESKVAGLKELISLLEKI